jgi:hypothetical protein
VTTREKFYKDQEEVSLSAFAAHTITKSGDGRWVIQDNGSSILWAEIICTHGRGLYVDGDIEPVVFRYGPDDFHSRVAWMGSRPHAWDSYFREKASIGMSGRDAIEVWNPEIALSDFREWLKESECADRSVDDVVAILGRDCTRDDFLREAENVNVDMETFYDMGAVPSVRMFHAHAALQRLVTLLDTCTTVRQHVASTDREPV